MGFYFFLKNLRYLPDVNYQRYAAQKKFPDLTEANFIGASSRIPCRSLLEADFLKKGDTVVVACVALISPHPIMLGKVLSKLHDNGISVEILDIDYHDIHGSESRDYELLKAYTQAMSQYSESSRKDKQPHKHPGRPSYRLSELNIRQQKAIEKFIYNKATAKETLMELQSCGLSIGKTTLYKLRKQYKPFNK